MFKWGRNNQFKPKHIPQVIVADFFPIYSHDLGPMLDSIHALFPLYTTSSVAAEL